MAQEDWLNLLPPLDAIYLNLEIYSNVMLDQVLDHRDWAEILWPQDSFGCIRKYPDLHNSTHTCFFGLVDSLHYLLGQPSIFADQLPMFWHWTSTTPLCHAGGSCLPLKSGRTASTGWIVLYQLLSCYKMGIFVNLTSLVFWATLISPIYTLDNKWDNKLILTTLRSLASCNLMRPSCKFVLKPH